jgi:ribonuclease-3
VYLAEQMAKLDLQSYLRVSVGDAQRSVQNEKSVLEDLFESIIGAVYADSGKNLTIVKCVVQKILPVTDFLSENDRKIKISYKNSLQEWCQKRGFAMPIYVISLGANGVTECTCSVIELNISERATGKNKKEAEMNAAQRLLERLQKEYVPATEKLTVTLEDSINALQEYCQAKKLACPVYESVSDIIQNDNSHEFTVRCTLNDLSVNGVGSQKKEAKKMAALAMLKLLGLAD